MTKKEIESLLAAALEASRCGDDELLDHCFEELKELFVEKIEQEVETRLWNEAKKIPGGYHYAGVCSDQLCFRLQDGGELRLSVSEADDADGNPSDMKLHIDHYSGMLPPGITGPVWKTGEEK